MYRIGHSGHAQRRNIVLQNEEKRWQTMTLMNLIVSVQGVKSLGGHFACLWRGLNFLK